MLRHPLLCCDSLWSFACYPLSDSSGVDFIEGDGKTVLPGYGRGDKHCMVFMGEDKLQLEKAAAVLRLPPGTEWMETCYSTYSGRTCYPKRIYLHSITLRYYGYRVRKDIQITAEVRCENMPFHRV